MIGGIKLASEEADIGGREAFEDETGIQVLGTIKNFPEVEIIPLGNNNG